MTEVKAVGIVGAGTMGAGIAQIACLGDYETYLHDPISEALANGADRLRAALDKGAERGRWSAEEAKAASGRLHPCERLEELAPCDLVVEAAPESLELKRDLFAKLSEICGDQVILATNTSSLLVTEMASAAARPERVCGMHFFNPPAFMPLVEIVAGIDTAADTLQAATEVGRRMGRTPIRAADGPGFLANRVARPFGLEALRLLGDQVATHDQIDRICRIGGGFRMGPFELMDLVGIDVGFQISKSFYEQSFHEPRWQPHPIQAQMTAAGRHGRKSGRGYYDYTSGPHRPEDPEPPQATTSDLKDPPALPHAFLPPFEKAKLVELARTPQATDQEASEAQTYFESRGKHVEWVNESPGFVLPRIVCQVVNEATFALQKGIGTAEDIDTAMRLGFNYPQGPIEWGRRMGFDYVLGVLDNLYETLHEERYRASLLLRRMAAGG